MDVVIVTGLSGAGKTKAIEWFEDRGYYCVDNIPPALINNFIELTTGARKIKKAAFVTDIRGGDFLADSKAVIENLKKDSNINFKMLFIEASNEALIRRYKETRRMHPLSNMPITNAIIEEEKGILSDLRAEANYIKEGKYSLTIAVGCTGGQHRSVVLANEIARIFREEGRRVTLEHRELK